MSSPYGEPSGRPGAAPRFTPLPPPDRDAVARVVAGTARRLQRVVEKRTAEDEDALARDEPLLALLAAASLRARSASGPSAGERWQRLGDRAAPHIEIAPLGLIRTRLAS
jgi:hypothetical protein